jgi:hypothetical protein
MRFWVPFLPEKWITRPIGEARKVSLEGNRDELTLFPSCHFVKLVGIECTGRNLF